MNTNAQTPRISNHLTTMDYPTSPKQSTLTQYSMSASGDDKHSVQEEIANDYIRANAISTVKSAIENNHIIFDHHFDIFVQ